MTIDKISKDGFHLNKSLPYITSVAFISLRSSLIAYFNTYKALNHPLSKVVNENDNNDAFGNHGINYIEKCCQSITNFHHFVELILKDILNRKHVLLAIDASIKDLIFHDLIFNEKANETEIEGTKQLEFSRALDRVTTLIENDRLNRDKYQFVVDNKKWLQKLNELRNRIAHRGVFIIKYKALDYLFGKFAFPFLLKITSLPEYKSNLFWLHKQLHIQIDPIKEIIKSFSTEEYSAGKIAVLKEFAKAAYENPLYGKIGIDIDKESINRSEILSKHVSETEDGSIENCPVCGLKTLVLFNDYFDEENEHGETLNNYKYIYKVKCFCCSFQLDNEISDFENINDLYPVGISPKSNL